MRLHGSVITVSSQSLIQKKRVFLSFLPRKIILNMISPIRLLTLVALVAFVAALDETEKSNSYSTSTKSPDRLHGTSFTSSETSSEDDYKPFSRDTTLPPNRPVIKPELTGPRPTAQATKPGDQPSFDSKPQVSQLSSDGPKTKRDTSDQEKSTGTQKPQSEKPTPPGLSGNRESLTKPEPTPSLSRPVRQVGGGQSSPPRKPAQVTTPKTPSPTARATTPKSHTQTTRIPTSRPQVRPGTPKPLSGQLPTSKPGSISRPVRDTNPQNGQQRPQIPLFPSSNENNQNNPNVRPTSSGNFDGPFIPTQTQSNNRPVRDDTPQTGQQRPQPLPFPINNDNNQNFPTVRPVLSGNFEGLNPLPSSSNSRPVRDTNTKSPQTTPSKTPTQKPKLPGSRPVRDVTTERNQQKPQPLPVLIATQKPQATTNLNSRPVREATTTGKPTTTKGHATTPKSPTRRATTKAPVKS